MKIDWIIYRIEQNEKGTISQNLVFQPEGWFDTICHNLELPYKSNNLNISCIPSGIYPFEKRSHQTRGKIIRILNVPFRSGILVHVGNFLKDTEGCVLPCQKLKINKEGSEYVGNESYAALERLWASLPMSGYVHIISQS